MKNDDYIYRERIIIEKVKIPKGYVKCPVCNGSGKIKWFAQRRECWKCEGKGFVSEDYIERMKKLRGGIK